jgi:endonuclease YncB( thermonuclease family)
MSDKILLSDIDFFSFKNYETRAYILDIYDGDTLTCIFKFNNTFYKFKIRMYGYDAPELKPSKTIEKEKRDKIIENANITKKYLEDKLLNKWIYLLCDDFDKYGRILGKIKINKTDETFINDDIVKLGLGYKYFGGKKEN